MKWSSIVGYFFAGATLTNGMPHLIIALTGRRNLTPFGRDSSASVNLLWGLANFIVGYLLMRYADREAQAQANAKTWLVPYEAGRVFWSSFGLLYSLYIVILKKVDQDKK